MDTAYVAGNPLKWRDPLGLRGRPPQSAVEKIIERIKKITDKDKYVDTVGGVEDAQDKIGNGSVLDRLLEKIREGEDVNVEDFRDVINAEPGHPSNQNNIKRKSSCVK